MKFAENRPVKIVMLGAGGTGGHIAPHLYRLLYALERPVRFIICDGDIVEEKNLVRQNFTPADFTLLKSIPPFHLLTSIPTILFHLFACGVYNSPLLTFSISSAVIPQCIVTL